MASSFRACTLVGLSFLLALPLAAQDLDVGNPMRDYLRTLQLADGGVEGSMTILPVGSLDVSAEGLSGPWAESPTVQRFLARQNSRLGWDVETRLYYNSGFPRGDNDGSVWQGRGLTAALEGGGFVRWGRLQVSLRPSVRWNANGAFALAPASQDPPGQSIWAYPWRPIDLPQRFGPDSFWTADLGQSEVRVDAGPLVLGLSTRDAWWGPGQRNAIVLSNAAGGVPRAFLGSSKPLATSFAQFEWQWMFGRLTRSDWFQPDEVDPGRYLTGWIVTVSPDAVPGLHLGGTFMSYGRVPPSGVSADEYVASLVPRDTTQADQLGSVFFRWVLPESGFELYAEWARNDRSGDIQDFLLEPEHSQGYTLGLEKAFAWGATGGISVLAELTHLQAEATSRLRDNPTFYAHSVAIEGYTHKGQLLGALAGPGGIQQHLGVSFFSPKGRANLWVQRAVRDNDAFYVWAENTDFDGCLYCQHDVTFTLGSELLVSTNALETGWSALLSRQRNRWFEGPDVWNLTLGARVRTSGHH